MMILVGSFAGTSDFVAAQSLNTTNKLEGVLVVDVSLSMDESDKEKVSNEAMKMFIDMASVSGDKIGIVAYTDEVMREKALVEIKSEEDKTDLKKFIDSLTRQPYTDLSVGVSEAVKILDKGHEDGYFPMMIVLADGNDDFNESKSRKQTQADKDLQKAVEQAKSNGYPIYTIGLNADGMLNKDKLENIAAETKGKFFETSSAENLPAILSEIFADHLKLKVVPIESFKASGKFQEINVNVPNDNVMEANISIMSNKAVEVKLFDPDGKEQKVPGDQVFLSTSQSYSMLKLLNPSKGDWILKVKGVKEDQIDINLVFNYDLNLKLASLTKNSFEAGEKVNIEAFFEEEGESIKEKGLYESISATLFVKDLDTNTVEEVALDSDVGFKGSFTLGSASSYELIVKAQDNSFYRETEPTVITVSSQVAAPVVAETKDVEENGTFPWLFVIMGIIGALLLGLLLLALLAVRKKANRGFSGQVVIEIKDEDTGERSSPKYKKLNQFRGKVTLHQLLSLAPEFGETNQIVLRPSKGDDLLLIDKSGTTIEKSGRAVDASKGTEIKRNNRFRIVLKQVNKSIYLEYIA